MIEEGIFVPLDSKAQAQVWSAVARSGYPQTGEGLALWLSKQAEATPAGNPLLAMGRDYIAKNPQAIQNTLQLLGAVLTKGKIKP